MTLEERYFKALGWRPNGNGNDISYWEAPECPSRGTNTLIELPNITESFSAFKKYVLEEMGRREMYPDISLEDTIMPDGMGGETDGPIIKVWLWTHAIKLKQFECEIKDNEILSAAVEGACEYLEKEKK